MGDGRVRNVGNGAGGGWELAAGESGTERVGLAKNPGCVENCSVCVGSCPSSLFPPLNINNPRSPKP